MMPYGPISCLDCGFRVEDKTVQPNPFLQAEPRSTEAPRQSLGEALYALSKSGGKRQAEPPEAGESSESPDPTGDEVERGR